MIIANAKKESNIAEYLLYMWQLEDLFRANDLDEKKLYQLLVSPLKLEEDKKKEIWTTMVKKQRRSGKQF